jgi:hypothetical protein
MKTQATKLRLLMTAAAFVGCTAIAAAQTPQSPSGSGAAPAAGQSEQKGGTGGAMMHQPSGEKAPGATGTQSAQSPNGMKPDQRAGQNAAPGEKNEKGSQRGAQEERGTQQKGAQEEHNERGAQSESGKAGVKTQESTQGSATTSSRGASAQLSKDQRTRISTVIGKNSSARIKGRPDFDVTVGVRVPHSVHVEVLPEDVVTIVPQYRGFDYVMVGDQILIIDPSTYEIVAVIEA